MEVRFSFTAMFSESIQTAAKLIEQAEACVVFAGAGMSANAGIPTYRGENGALSQPVQIGEQSFDAEGLSVHRAFETHYEAAWEYFLQRLRLFNQNKPHQGYHQLLHILKPKEYFVVTSNIDSYFARAGFEEHQIAEIHGSARYFQCMDPAEKEIWLLDEDFDPPYNLVPTCPHCAGKTRPNVRFFEDWFWRSQRAKDQEKRYVAFLKAIASKPTVLLEIGAGRQLPYIRRAAERLIKPSVPLVRINPEGERPTEQVHLLQMDALSACSQLYQLLGV